MCAAPPGARRTTGRRSDLRHLGLGFSGAGGYCAPRSNFWFDGKLAHCIQAPGVPGGADGFGGGSDHAVAKTCGVGVGGCFSHVTTAILFCGNRLNVWVFWACAASQNDWRVGRGCGHARRRPSNGYLSEPALRISVLLVLPFWFPHSYEAVSVVSFTIYPFFNLCLPPTVLPPFSIFS